MFQGPRAIGAGPFYALPAVPAEIGWAGPLTAATNRRAA